VGFCHWHRLGVERRPHSVSSGRATVVLQKHQKARRKPCSVDPAAGPLLSAPSLPSPRNNGCCGEREITMRSPPPPPASCAAPVAPAEASARTRASSSSSSAMRSRGASARAQLENQDAFGRKSAGCRYAWRVVPRPSAKSGCRYAPRPPSKSSSGKNWTVPAE